MCLVAFAINASSRWPLVIASNRDESFNRPTLPLQRWTSPSGETVFSGRDVRGGGTWLGVNKAGRAAFLTNVREGPASGIPAPRSRGELVMRWLESNVNAAEFRSQISPDEYGGFNLVVGDWKASAWTWLGNRPGPGAADGVVWVFRDLASGIYGLSNAALDTPWPKTVALKTALGNALEEALDQQSAAGLETALWRALASRREASEKSLPSTGVPLQMEKALSSAFVYAPERAYGTRCSTLLIGEHRRAAEPSLALQIQEQTFPPGQLPAAGHHITRQTLDWPA